LSVTLDVSLGHVHVPLIPGPLFHHILGHDYDMSCITVTLHVYWSTVTLWHYTVTRHTC